MYNCQVKIMNDKTGNAAIDALISKNRSRKLNRIMKIWILKRIIDINRAHNYIFIINI